jgi:N-acetylglucosaminyldiphosphoundecaprenol N-acetyl-beta-D-mannosaminyltransferase
MSSQPVYSATFLPTDLACSNMPVVQIDGLPIRNVTEKQCVAHIINAASEGQGGWVVTPNADIARQCARDLELRDTILAADLLVADGMSLVWASHLRGTPLQGRVCGSDLVWSVANAAQASGLSIFLLGGGQPHTARSAAQTLQARYPQLKIAGTWFPPFGFEHEEEELERMYNALRAADPDIIYVALGFPKAEKLIQNLRTEHPKSWWLGIGISLSFIDGEVKRAPRWMQAAGLEWLHRMSQEPGRLAKRYLWHDVPYVIRLLAGSLLHRLRRSDTAPGVAERHNS